MKHIGSVIEQQQVYELYNLLYSKVIWWRKNYSLVSKHGSSQYLPFIRRSVWVSDVASALAPLSLTQTLCLPSASSDWLTTVWTSNTKHSGEAEALTWRLCVFVHVCGKIGGEECESNSERRIKRWGAEDKEKTVNIKAFSVVHTRPWDGASGRD